MKKTNFDKMHPNEFLASKEFSLVSFAGKLKSSSNFSGDPLSLQKKLRDEWNRANFNPCDI